MNKEETMLAKRLTELSKTAYHRDIVTFSDFLNLNELHICSVVGNTSYSNVRSRRK